MSNIRISKTDREKQRQRGMSSQEVEEMDTTEQGQYPGMRRHGTDLGSSETGHKDIQAQSQLQRSMEASKQMLYGVFGNVITILEEYEKRELKKHKMAVEIPQSDVYIPDQGHKNFEDVESIVETQLLLFETQSKACPSEAKAEILDELKKRTLSWSAVREEIGIKEIQQTDKYIAKLYEILARGKTDHKPVGGQEVTEEVMKEGFQAMIYGEHDRAKLDEEFKKNRDKKANAPNTRGSEHIDAGANRILRSDKTLGSHITEDMHKIEQNGPEDLK